MSQQHIAVVGAGAFGGWTALSLVRAGARVTLLDAWGPGNGRASSGGETRLIRGIYGAEPIYIKWVAEAFEHWRALERDCGVRFYHPTGALWLFCGDDGYARGSLAHLKANGLAVQSLTPHEAAKQFPLIRFDDIEHVYLEQEAGYLLARQACEAVVRCFIKEGGRFLRAHAKPGTIQGERLQDLRLGNGERLIADQYVFACGPWLGGLFEAWLGGLIQPTRQEMFFFGLPEDGGAYAELPVWMDFGERVYYGVPDAAYRGFKAGDDTRGAAIDPSSADRGVGADAPDQVRERVRWRFPGLKALPLLEARVCQYENTPDGQFIIDRHPQARNLRFLGGGSGHGFKVGPSLGRYMAAHLLADSDTDPYFALARFQRDHPRGPQLGRS